MLKNCQGKCQISIIRKAEIRKKNQNKPQISPGGASDGELCPVLDSSGHERHGGPGVGPAQDN